MTRGNDGSPGTGSRGRHESPDPQHESLLRDAEDDDWAWRRAIRARPVALAVYRTIVFTVGGILLIGGLILVPLPGPGWLIVFTGLAVIASEFEPAHRLLQFGKAWLHRWNVWMKRQPLWIQAGVGLLTFAFVLAVVWVTMRLSGIPSLVPEWATEWLVRYAGLHRADW